MNGSHVPPLVKHLLAAQAAQFMVGQVEIFLLPDRLELLYWQSAKADIANSSVILS